MTDKLDFSMPQREANKSPVAKGLHLLVVAGLVAIVVNVVLTVALARRPARPETAKSGLLTGEAQKDLALKLEKQGLNARAVDAWKEYLALASQSGEETARILYRIGTLCQEAGDYERALDSYYRSESCATIAEISQEIGKRTAQCLEALGKFSALRYELDKRVGANTNSKTVGAEVVAELGITKITREELDRKIEDQIERQLARFASTLPDEDRKKQKEAMFQRASSSSERLQALNNLVAEELLYRRAVELKLGEDPKLRYTIRDLERSVLAEQALRRELAEQVKLSRSDIETWYEAHKKEYVTPERARIAHILVKDEEAAKVVQKRLEAGEKFEDVAKELSADKRTSGNGGAIEGWVEKGADVVPGVGRSQGASAVIFGTAAGKISEKTVKADNGVSVVKVLQIEPERQRPLEEVQQAVHSDLYSTKVREAQEGLFERLKKQHNVTIHYSAFPMERGQQENIPEKK